MVCFTSCLGDSPHSSGWNSGAPAGTVERVPTRQHLEARGHAPPWNFEIWVLQTCWKRKSKVWTKLPFGKLSKNIIRRKYWNYEWVWLKDWTRRFKIPASLGKPFFFYKTAGLDSRPCPFTYRCILPHELWIIAPPNPEHIMHGVPVLGEAVELALVVVY